MYLRRHYFRTFLSHSLCIFLSRLLCISIIFAAEITAKNGQNGTSPVVGQKTKWISQLMSEAEDAFTMDEGVSDKCKRDYKLYELHRQNQSVWALRSKFSSVQNDKIRIFFKKMFFNENFAHLVLQHFL